MVHGYIKKKHTSNPLSVVNDPCEMICLDLIKTSVQKEADEIVHTAVAFLIDEYIVESQYVTYFRRVMVGKFVNEVLKEAIDESIIENMIGKIIDGILDGFVEPLVLLTAEEEYFEQEGEEIEKAFEEFERREILQVIVDDLVEKLDDINMEYIADQAIKHHKYKEMKDDYFQEIQMLDEDL